MKHAVDPRQTSMLDPYRQFLSSMGMERLEKDWPGVFRHVALELMPVREVGAAFNPQRGRPTKELYSMCGLTLIMEFNQWTSQEASDAYMLDTRVQYALNLEPCGQTMTPRTVERYKRIFVERELAARTMEEVTAKLAEVAELNTTKLRVDSTHVFADLAIFGRTRLMGTAVKRFLVQLKRHDPERYDALPEALRMRYAPSAQRLFVGEATDAPSRRRLRGEVAQDMRGLIEAFADGPHAQRSTYRDMARIFAEQCEVIEGKVEVKASPGNRTVQNPSDMDSTREGPKGAGYKVQIAETCSETNEVQMVVAAIAQQGAEDDREAMPTVLEAIEEKGLETDTILADTHYGSDADLRRCAEKGIELIAPAPKAGNMKDPEALNLADFETDPESGKILRCPEGHAPVASVYEADKDSGSVTMPAGTCECCPRRKECPVRYRRGGEYRLTWHGAERRLQVRRRVERTDAFRERYRRRSGIEGTNSGMKRRTGLGRVRVRGRPSVFHSIYMKVCGWTLLRATASEKVRLHVAAKAAQRALHLVFQAFFHSAGLSASLRACLCRLPVPFSCRPSVVMAKAVA